MRLCRFNENRLGLIRGNHVCDVTEALEQLPVLRWPFPPGDQLIAHLDQLRPVMEQLAETAARVDSDAVTLLSPVANPGKILAAPVNYQKHLEESRADQGIHYGNEVKTIHDYGLFVKASSALVGPGEGVVVDRPERRTDHEAELAVIIGAGGRRIAQADAMQHVAGYAIGLDMTIRGTEDRSYRKSLDSFAVLGPWLVSTDEISDPGNLDFHLKVNGELRQSSNTRHLIFDISKLIAYASAAFTLHPGDIIMTGTPEGVGPVAPGDLLAVWIDRIGSMEVAIRAE